MTRKPMAVLFALLAGLGLAASPYADVRIGSNAVAAAYLGSGLVWHRTPPAPVPVFWWTLDDSATNTAVLDNGSNCVHGTMSLANTADRATGGISGGALNFCMGEYFSAGGAASNVIGGTAWTLSFWTKRAEAAHAQMFSIGAEYIGDRSSCYYNTDYSVMLFYADAATLLDQTFTFAPNEWRHVAFVRDGGYYLFYVDGVLMKETAKAGAEPGNVTVLTVGGYGAAYGGTVTLDDVRLYSAALSAAQVGALYLSYGYTPPPPPPPTYTLYFNALGGSVDPSSIALVENTSYGAANGYSFPTPVMEGYTFNGWELYYPGSGYWVSAYDSYTGGGDVTLYANWTLN